MSQKIKFAHLADLHLGSWREKKLTQLNFETFKLSINKIIEEKVDFCIFCGDIFNNAMPPIEIVTRFVVQIQRLKDNKIPLYVIGGSHDYSASQKSFLQLLDITGILTDVCKFDYIDKNKIKLNFTKDEKNKTNLCGVLGKKNGLDKNIYSNLNSNTLSEDAFNIFLFHATLNDFKPDSMSNIKSETDTSFLPKSFDYYAGGHIHKNMKKEFENHSIIVYPGCLFPNNFSELKTENPTFNICEFNFKTRKTKVQKIQLNVYEKIHFNIEVEDLNPIEAKNKIIEEIEKKDVNNKIVLLEITGVINGKISDIEINKIVSDLYEKKGAFHVLKNTYKLRSSLLQKIDIELSSDIKEVENSIIKESLKESKEFEKDFNLIKSLLKLEFLKLEGEKVAQYEERVVKKINMVVKD